jgi:hypothetical protein
MQRNKGTYRIFAVSEFGERKLRMTCWTIEFRFQVDFKSRTWTRAFCNFAERCQLSSNTTCDQNGIH